jgi:hypothetical protein
MLIRFGRKALIAGLVTAGASMPALAADADTVGAGATLPDQTVVVASSAASGPVLDRQSLGTEKDVEQVAVVGGSEPTRSLSNLAALKRARAARASGGYTGGGYRPSGGHALILGIRF